MGVLAFLECARSYLICRNGRYRRTLTSSHACTFLIPSPASLNPSLVSSSKSCTRSRTRSVSLRVPSRAIWFERCEMLDVRVKSWVERVSVARLK